MSRPAPPGIATFDSATRFVGGVAGALNEEGFPESGKGPRGFLRRPFFRRGAESVARVGTEAIARWVVSRYPRRRYPGVMIGSSNGALAHACAALGIPFLPQTFLVPAKHRRIDPDDAAAALDAGRSAVEELLAREPDIAVHHVHDPNQNRSLAPFLSTFRIKFLALPSAYRQFLRECLLPGGTVYLSECGMDWPVTRLAERYVFQFGSAGGATRREYFEGGPRVKRLFDVLGINRERWCPPDPTEEAPEGEWGFEPALRRSIDAIVEERSLRTVGVRHEEPEHTSAAVAQLYRRVYAHAGTGARRLLISSYTMQDPYWTLRTGSVPLWMLFNVEASQKLIRDHVRAAGPFDEIALTLFPNAAPWIGQAPTESWHGLFKLAETRGYFLGIDEKAYPQDFRSLGRYHRDLKKLRPLTDMPEPAPLAWFERYLSDSGVTGLKSPAARPVLADAGRGA